MIFKKYRLKGTDLYIGQKSTLSKCPKIYQKCPLNAVGCQVYSSDLNDDEIELQIKRSELNEIINILNDSSYSDRKIYRNIYRFRKDEFEEISIDI